MKKKIKFVVIVAAALAMVMLCARPTKQQPIIIEPVRKEIVVSNTVAKRKTKKDAIAATAQDIVSGNSSTSTSGTQERTKTIVSETPFNAVPTPPQQYHLTARLGRIQGPSGQETWYNLPMGGVINIMRNMGFTQEEYPYWIRQDGAKMLGPYIIVAANLELRPRGTTVETSLGTGLVCDTGQFASYNATQVDVATNW